MPHARLKRSFRNSKPAMVPFRTGESYLLFNTSLKKVSSNRQQDNAPRTTKLFACEHLLNYTRTKSLRNSWSGLNLYLPPLPILFRLRKVGLLRIVDWLLGVAMPVILRFLRRRLSYGSARPPVHENKRHNRSGGNSRGS